jgi:hypothetical protein
MTKIVYEIKGGLLSYCGKVYSHGNIDQKHRIGGVFNANSAIFQLYYDENKLIINEMMMMSALF